MHLQQAWFHEYLAHQVAMSTTFLAVPQKQVGHFPDGQLPPHESAKATTKTKKNAISIFISFYINRLLLSMEILYKDD